MGGRVKRGGELTGRSGWVRGVEREGGASVEADCGGELPLPPPLRFSCLSQCVRVGKGRCVSRPFSSHYQFTHGLPTHPSAVIIRVDIALPGLDTPSIPPLLTNLRVAQR